MTINDFKNTDDNKFVNTTDNKWRGIKDMSLSSGDDPPEPVDISPPVSNLEFDRKPYTSGSYARMMNTPTWRAVVDARGEEPQSEFEKPYFGEPYDRMQHFYPIEFPNLALPQWKFPEYRGATPPQSKCTHCLITCHDGTVRSGECDDGKGKCSVSVACFKGEILSGQRGQQYKWDVAGDPIDHIDYFADAIRSDKLSSGRSGGSGIGIEIYPSWDDIDINKDGYKVAYYDVMLTDGLGHTCLDSLKVTCAETCCPAETAFALGSNPETIAREGSATITTTGGCAPYVWSVTGTGFSIPSKTNNGINILGADNTACGSATITITDACGSSLTEYVRCTTGTWTKKSDTCELGGTGTLISGTFPACSGGCLYQVISGYQKQEQTIWRTGSGDTYCADYASQCSSGNKYECTSGDAGLQCEDCGIAPVALCSCREDYDGSTDMCWCSSNIDYYEWECA